MKYYLFILFVFILNFAKGQQMYQGGEGDGFAHFKLSLKNNNTTPYAILTNTGTVIAYVNFESSISEGYLVDVLGRKVSGLEVRNGSINELLIKREVAKAIYILVTESPLKATKISLYGN